MQTKIRLFTESKKRISHLNIILRIMIKHTVNNERKLTFLFSSVCSYHKLTKFNHNIISLVKSIYYITFRIIILQYQNCLLYGTQTESFNR